MVQNGNGQVYYNQPVQPTGPKYLLASDGDGGKKDKKDKKNKKDKK